MLHPSQALRKIFRAAGTGDVAVRELASWIAEEEGLGPRLVRYAAAFYGSEDSDPARLVTFLGPKVVFQVAVHHALVLALSDSRLPPEVLATLWSDFLRRALAGRLLAEKLEGVPPDLAFTLGLALDFGTALLLERDSRPTLWLNELRYLRGEERSDREKAAFGMTRHQAFGRTAAVWGLPDTVSKFVSGYAKPPAPTEDLWMRRTITWADRLGEAVSSRQPLSAMEDWVEAAARDLRQPRQELWPVVETTLEQVPNTAKLLGVEVGEAVTLDLLRGPPDAEAGPVRAEEWQLWVDRLVTQKKALEAQNDELRAENERLRSTDFVTGLPGTSWFTEVVRREISASRRDGIPVCLLLVDIDNFVELNGRLGRVLCDHVLREVAQVLRRLLRDGDVVARVGPDDFALLIHADERGGHLVAERVRAAVEGTKIERDDLRLRVTATVTGVALENCPADHTPDQFLAALYRARAEVRGQSENRSHWFE